MQRNRPQWKLLTKLLPSSIIQRFLMGMILFSSFSFGQEPAESLNEVPLSRFSDFRSIVHLRQSGITLFLFSAELDGGEESSRLYRYQNGQVTLFDLKQPAQAACTAQWTPTGLKAATNGDQFAVTFQIPYANGYPVCAGESEMTAIYAADGTLLRSLAGFNLLSGNFRFALRNDGEGVKKQGCTAALALQDLQSGSHRPIAVCRYAGTEAFAIPFALDEEGSVYRIGAGIVGKEAADGSNSTEFAAAAGNEPQSQFLHSGLVDRSMFVGALTTHSFWQQGGTLQLVDMRSKSSRVISFSGFAPLLDLDRNVVVFLAATRNPRTSESEDPDGRETRKVFQYSLQSHRIHPLSPSASSYLDCALAPMGIQCLSEQGKIEEFKALDAAK